MMGWDNKENLQIVNPTMLADASLTNKTFGQQKGKNVKYNL